MCFGSGWFSTQHAFPIALSWLYSGNFATLSLSVSTQHFPGNLLVLGRLCVLNWSHQTKWKEACTPRVAERLSLLSLNMSMEMCFLAALGSQFSTVQTGTLCRKLIN